MKNKILLASIIASILSANFALAADSPSLQEQLTNLSPIYLVVELGREGLHENVNYKGSVEAIGGKISIAKDILIGANEFLNGDAGEPGAQNSKIDYSFDSSFYKGFVLKVFPNPDFIPAADSNELGRLIFRQRILNSDQVVLEIPYSELLYKGFFSSGDYRVRSVYFDKNADLNQRNEAFSAKLEIASKMQFVLMWVRAQFLDGKISQDLYQKYDQLCQSAWQVYNADKQYFNWRLNRLKTYFAKQKATPALFYGGLSQLMKKMMP